MDDAIGRIIRQLSDSGFAAEDTLIIFTSDNGGIRQFGSVGPWRGQKGTLYEGGVRSPTVACWQGHLKAGQEVNEALHIVDLYPTLLRLAGGKLEQEKTVDGLDAWSTIADGMPSPHEAILLNSTPFTGAVIEGDWKLVRNGQVRANETEHPETEMWELFNLAKDASESKNLYNRRPEIAKRLATLLDEYKEGAVAPNIPPNTAPEDFKFPQVWGEAN